MSRRALYRVVRVPGGVADDPKLRASSVVAHRHTLPAALAALRAHAGLERVAHARRFGFESAGRDLWRPVCGVRADGADYLIECKEVRDEL